MQIETCIFATLKLFQTAPKKKKKILFVIFFLRPPVSYLVALNDKLQMNAKKVERNIIEAEQNLSRVSTEQLLLWITNQSQTVYVECPLKYVSLGLFAVQLQKVYANLILVLFIYYCCILN